MGANFEFFIGPCVLESKELVDQIASYLAEKIVPLGIPVTFKGSFDKANRTSIDSYRGPGIEKGMELLEYVKKTYKLPTLTDFHLPEQADIVAKSVDVLQIPAFLCRQTDMIIAGAKACKDHQRQLKIKKGQFLSPEETGNIVDKAVHFIPKSHILLTERGSSFGYNNLVVDMASFQIMKSFGVRAIHDATHCVQRPGGLGKTSGGKREQIVTLACAAVAAGADGVFMECHPNPDKAKSDASTSLELNLILPLVQKLKRIQEAIDD